MIFGRTAPAGVAPASPIPSSMSGTIAQVMVGSVRRITATPRVRPPALGPADGPTSRRAASFGPGRSYADSPRAAISELALVPRGEARAATGRDPGRRTYKQEVTGSGPV